MPRNFLLYGIYFSHSDFLNNLRLPWKTEGALNSIHWMYFFYHSGFLSNLRLPWKTEGALKFFAAFDIFFIVQEFWVTCACPEKQRVPWNFSLYLIYLLSFRSFEQLALALKTELPWNFSLCWIYFLHSEFLSNLRLPWKTELPWNFSLCWNIFHYSGL